MLLCIPTPIAYDPQSISCLNLGWKFSWKNFKSTSFSHHHIWGADRKKLCLSDPVAIGPYSSGWLQVISIKGPHIAACDGRPIALNETTWHFVLEIKIILDVTHWNKDASNTQYLYNADRYWFYIKQKWLYAHCCNLKMAPYYQKEIKAWIIKNTAGNSSFQEK